MQTQIMLDTEPQAAHDLLNDHRIKVERVNGQWRTRCSCGWRSAEFPTRAMAERKADGHVTKMWEDHYVS